MLNGLKTYLRKGRESSLDSGAGVFPPPVPQQPFLGTYWAAGFRSGERKTTNKQKIVRTLVFRYHQK